MAQPRLRVPSPRPLQLDRSELPFEPKNEQGVVYLFARLAEQLGVKVELVQTRFPDCVALKDGKRIEIEFEFRSRNYDHPRPCDWLVCWRHDWAGIPAQMQVVELRRVFGIGRGVWSVSLDGSVADRIPRGGGASRTGYSVPPQAGEGDLILIYRPHPERRISEIVQVASPIFKAKRDDTRREDWFARYRLATVLRNPITWDLLKSELPQANFVRGGMLARYSLLDNWERLFDLIVAENPAAAGDLRDFSPNNLR